MNIIFVENSAAIIPYLVSGQADFAGPLAYGNIAGLAQNSNIHLSTTGGYFGSFMMYNITQYPYNMTQFRQALAYSINTSAIVKQSLFGYGVAANDAQGGIPDTYAYYNTKQPTYSYSVSSAVNLLHSIGFTGGGSASTPLRFPNGTAMSVVLYSDSAKAWDPSVEQQVAGYLTNLGISVTTQTLTPQNLGADYASNAFNIRNNLVVYSSGGAMYFSPWVSAQQDCAVYGTPGCYGWFATNAPNGQAHEEWPPSADAQYQSNLTGIDNTPPTNTTGQEYYIKNIQQIRATYLPVIMLGFPAKVFAYNTGKWTNWPSFYMSNELSLNLSMFAALRPASGTTSTSSTTHVSTPSTTSATSTNSQASPTTTSTSSTQPSSLGVGTTELIAGVVVAIIVIGGIAAYVMRRRPTAAT
ncbi:MAG: ABC transporter substrate-binding protein [Thaumarchaeota archaeon]|nr:ABC transporter substrate-binding protein [Nitrososphaerota archaeon]